MREQRLARGIELGGVGERRVQREHRVERQSRAVDQPATQARERRVCNRPHDVEAVSGPTLDDEDEAPLARCRRQQHVGHRHQRGGRKAPADQATAGKVIDHRYLRMNSGATSISASASVRVSA